MLFITAFLLLFFQIQQKWKFKWSENNNNSTKVKFKNYYKNNKLKTKNNLVLLFNINTMFIPY